jgi:hypothetical protein
MHLVLMHFTGPDFSVTSLFWMLCTRLHWNSIAWLERFVEFYTVEPSRKPFIAACSSIVLGLPIMFFDRNSTLS